MRRMIEHFQNERGNIALLVMGSLVLMVVLFVLIINMGSVLATKEKSATTAKQTSLAATSTLYDEVRKVITDWDEDGDGKVGDFFEEFNDNVEEEEDNLRSGWSGSDNERGLEAVNLVIKAGKKNSKIRSELKQVFSDNKIQDKVINKAKSTITQNSGTLRGAELEIKGNQIHIKAANEFTSTSYEKFLKGIKEDIYQTSAGPEVSFLQLVFPSSFTKKLD